MGQTVGVPWGRGLQWVALPGERMASGEGYGGVLGWWGPPRLVLGGTVL